MEVKKIEKWQDLTDPLICYGLSQDELHKLESSVQTNNSLVLRTFSTSWIEGNTMDRLFIIEQGKGICITQYSLEEYVTGNVYSYYRQATSEALAIMQADPLGTLLYVPYNLLIVENLAGHWQESQSFAGDLWFEDGADALRQLLAHERGMFEW